MRAEWEVWQEPDRVWGQYLQFHLLSVLCSPPTPAESEQKEQPTEQKRTLKNDEL